MKTVLKQKDGSSKFPALYKNIRHDNLIVLFTGSITGIILQESENSSKLGEYCDCLINCNNATEWKRLNPGDSVELIQE